MSNRLKNWIPYKLDFVNDEWLINWLDLDNHIIKEPFFDETISLRRSAMANRSRLKSQSSLSFLLEQANEVESIPVTAFIFHVSRCGSTLLSQALGGEAQNIVIAEAPLFDEILRAAEKDKNLTDDQIRRCFMAALQFMGQKRSGREKQYFIKLDSWHLHFYEQLRLWFPLVTFYFISREPNAIIASHIKRRGIHAVPGYINPEVFRIRLLDRHYENFNFYTAEVLTGYYEKISALVALKEPDNHFYDYGWGVDKMLPHFFAAIGLSTYYLDKISDRLSFHSKYPGERFKLEETANSTTEGQVAEQAYQKMLETLINEKHNG